MLKRIIIVITILSHLKLSFSIAEAQDVNILVEWLDIERLNFTCEANRIYPEPTIKIFIQGPGKDSIR